MIGYAQALEVLLARAARLPAESCAVAAAWGRVLAGDVRSPMALPSFDHAAMDGYALKAGDALAAGAEQDVEGSQAAGDAAPASSGVAREIMTGAPLPDGLDAVVAVERTGLLAAHADGTPARIRLLDAVVQGSNVRRAGSDVAAGTVVACKGSVIEPAQVMLLGALGVTTVDVVRRPRVAIVCTGKELLADPGQPLAEGQIHNSNGPYLVAAFAACGITVLSCETVDDTATTYMQALRRARDAGADLIISTGAVSMGRYDFVPDALRALGAELLFHQVAIRPGKPVLAAALAGGTLVLGLPGTPMAVAAGFRFFVTPLLRAMHGQLAEPAMHAVLDTLVQPKPGLRHFLRGCLRHDHDGRLHIEVPAQQQPFRIQPFAQANAWAVLPEAAGECAPGRVIEVFTLEPSFSMAVRPPSAAG
ncbi:molybdopterin molybdotransferase MoeA [Dyella soli]|uniref:Molybdopterin molybdenumtransferase n=1 Tax=Dyella soli TaxID=522319 RepID=A0A4R0YN99_9GAMM|nr:gephyrin-like molybdotransferase Glp [Dyella soli]TCI10246.1 molybdopterin molybdenumtransferase MoeA [Dyella soli]